MVRFVLAAGIYTLKTKISLSADLREAGNSSVANVQDSFHVANKAGVISYGRQDVTCVKLL